jgi:hypothetical protein
VSRRKRESDLIIYCRSQLNYVIVQLVKDVKKLNDFFMKNERLPKD